MIVAALTTAAGDAWRRFWTSVSSGYRRSPIGPGSGRQSWPGRSCSSRFSSAGVLTYQAASRWFVRNPYPHSTTTVGMP